MEYVYYSVVDQVAALSVCRTHMQDLKDYTQDIHYENFRKKKLLQASPGYVSNAANTPTHTPTQQSSRYSNANYTES